MARNRNDRDRQREETRRRVFRAALEVFRRDGVDQARIEDVANLAGVSRGTFYFHFPSKDDVLLELVRESEASLCRTLAALPEETPLSEVVLVFARGMAAEWSGEPRLLGDVGMVILRNATAGLAVQRESHPARLALEPHVARAVARGEIEALLPASMVTDFFLVNLFSACLAWVGNPVVPLDRLLETVAHFFLKATRPDPHG